MTAPDFTAMLAASEELFGRVICRVIGRSSRPLSTLPLSALAEAATRLQAEKEAMV